jgi:hypothetical protein
MPIDLESLEALSADERSEIRARLDLLEKSTKPMLSREDMVLWDAIMDEFPGRQPLAAFVTGYGIRKYRDRGQILADLVARAAPGATAPMRDAIRGIILHCLFKYLESWGHPFGPKAMLDHMDKAHHAVDQDWPGYVRNGMLHLVITFASKK